ncbi:hypothetical protein OESDEN_08821 [Oesophagostomum dentatum]|uniref:Uncharacterized protein n=1 Tax=Oesophagostomum dentatum TaxID=61180 RepID=A0A0B1T688_OESDE|nr:hypothetical protein OESDEN_08821 [Oesophagostomum dentatum]
MGECEVRDALMGEVKRHRYWKSSAFKKMQFDRLEMLSCLHYVLESFTEARSTSEATEAVTPGQILDQATTSIQNPWDYEVLPSSMFTDQVRVLEMPGSSTINSVRLVILKEPTTAFIAAVWAQTSAIFAGTHDLCYMCHGRGVKECHHCKGCGKKPCTACCGTGSVRNFTKLKVYFKTERSEFFTETEVPEKLLIHASGKEIFSEEQPYVCLFDTVLPITKYPVQEINEKSKLFCAQHLQNSMGMCRVIQQRHCLVAIPVCKVYYTLGNTKGIFFVYGNDRQCYVPNFPSKCVIL